MKRERLTFYGGTFGAMAPFVLFLAGVAMLGLAGVPDERGFWPVLLAAFGLGLVLARDRALYAEIYLRGMSQPIVMTMVMAWILAGVLGTLIGASGLVPALTSLVARAGIEGGGFVVAAFLICSVVSTATGTSLGTVLVVAPLLYPVGGALGAAPAALIGAILGGATFGDNVSPVSDTTIASATTQGASMGEVVRTRLTIALPAATLAIFAYLLFGGASTGEPTAGGELAGADLRPLAMLLAPAVSIVLMLRGRHLVEGLLFGCLAAGSIALVAGWIRPSQLLFLDREQFLARGLVLEGMQRAVGVSVFTLLLMGLVAPLEALNIPGRWIASPNAGSSSPRKAELRIFGAVSAAVLLTTHSVVAILATGKLAREVGERNGISRARRANLLDVTVCTYSLPPTLFHTDHPGRFHHGQRDRRRHAARVSATGRLAQLPFLGALGRAAGEHPAAPNGPRVEGVPWVVR